MWGWESFEEYLDVLGGLERAIDFGTQVPHGALRAYVMGERGAANENANADDIGEMSAIVKRAIEAGALGFSTSRTLLHKSIDGVPVPGTFAAKDELFGIGAALKAAGRGVFQLATDHASVPAELEWMEQLSLRTGAPVMFNLSQIDQAPELWKVGLQRLEQARANGANVAAQVAGRAIGIVMGWHLTAHPFAARPSFLQLMHKSKAERMAALRSPGFREKLLAEAPIPLGEFETFVTTSFDKMFPMTDAAVDYEPGPDRSLAAIARAQGRKPQEVAFDMLMAEDGDGMLYFPLFNYSDSALDVLEQLHRHPATRMGLSDAGAHCGAICDGGMPTFMLAFWTRDRTRGPRLELEHVVRRQTSETAACFGLNDRGVLKPGFRADVNVIDYDNLRLERPEVVYDLPAGGRRLLQRAVGYRSTIVNGVPIVHGGQRTGALPGRLIRGPQSL